jgi:non-ribosomal peptide synthetase component F
VGSPLAGRDRAELERLIGPFVNHLVFRADLSGDPSFRVLLRQVQALALDLHEQKGASFERLRERYANVDDPARAPLFQTRFLVHNTPPPGPVEGLTYDTLHARRTVAFFDLSLGLEEKNGWCGSFEYNTDLFDPDTISRFVRELERRLALAAAEPDWPISRLVCAAPPIVSSDRQFIKQAR